MKRREVNLPDTILFDMGGTIEDIWYNDETAAAVITAIRNLLDCNGLTANCSSDEFWQRLNNGVHSYKKWSQSVMLEKKPEDIWPDYYLREFGFAREKVVPLAETLAQTWETIYYHRELRPQVKETLESLRQRGYKLGVISNTASLYSVFNVLEQYEIRNYFSDVTLSSITGYRKPNPAIFQIALRQMQALPEQCVYVGDTVSRDVIGSKRAGFAKAVQICSFMTKVSDTETLSGANAPDHTIYQMEELVDYLDQLQNAERK
jgi:putative hydrolase of the HAD superfamily